MSNKIRHILPKKELRKQIQTLGEQLNDTAEALQRTNEDLKSTEEARMNYKTKIESITKKSLFLGLYSAFLLWRGGEVEMSADRLKELIGGLSAEEIRDCQQEIGKLDKISVRTYRAAVKLFKAIHINTPPSYRTRVLEEEKGEIRFRRGPGK